MTEETTEKDRVIYCFKHCSTSANIFYSAPLMEQCPICGRELGQTPQLVPPFRIENPFLKSVDAAPHSILIVPSSGREFRHEVKGANLHIGIRDSRGAVFGYDQNGIRRAEVHVWTSCIEIQIFPTGGELVQRSFDQVLDKSLVSPKWTKEKYDANNYNCYNYVLAMVEELSGRRLTREEFCERFILPRTVKAAKYTSLLRRIEREGYVVVDRVGRE